VGIRPRIAASRISDSGGLELKFVEMFRQFGEDMLGSWGSLTTSARVQLALTGLATAALVIFVVAWGASPEYVNLFSGLSPEDSALIKNRLVELDVPYRFEGNGSIIQVPRSRKTELQINMAAEGIPSSHSGVGFEIFDDSDMMTSKFINDVKKERAIMGTLQQMLNGLDFVKSSQVYITQAETTVFGDAQEPSKAAVTLNVRKKPSSGQIEGLLGIITSFGAANLTRETVTLALSDGTVLNAPGDNEFGGAGDDMLEANRSFEREYKKKAETLLADIGVGSVVSVSVNRDFSRQSQYEETFDKGQPISKETTSTEVSSTEALPQGAAGAIANLPDGDAVVPGGTQTKELTESNLENLELPSVVTTTEFQPGRVKLVSASATVAGKRVEELDEDGNPTGEVSYEKYSDEEVEHFKTTIASCIGYGMMKDDVEIAALDRPLDSLVFASAGATGAEQDSGMVGKINSVTTSMMENPLVWWFTRILLVVVALFILRRLAKGAVQEELPEEEEVPEAFSLDNALSPEDARKQEIAEEVSKISQQEPEAVAALLRTWLTEDEA